MAKLKYVYGDVTNPKGLIDASHIVIIPHVCNDLGVMGAGVAKAIKDKWGGVFKEYKEAFESYKRGNHSEPFLGQTILSQATNEHIWIANMVAQTGFRSTTNIIPLKYASLVKCMEEVKRIILTDKTIHPYINRVIIAPKFGSDLAGGDFNFIKLLIQEIWVDAGIDVTIYLWDKNDPLLERDDTEDNFGC